MKFQKENTQGALPPGTMMSTSVPARAPGFISDVVVPVMQAAFTGALIATALTFFVWKTGIDWDLLSVWAGAALLIATLAWPFLLKDTRKLLWAIENLIGQDLTGDAQVGKPTERLVVVNAPGSQEAMKAQNAAQEASSLAQFVAALPVQGTDLRTWEPRIGRAAYQMYRDVLISVGWARWKKLKADGSPHERGGWELVEDVEEILKRIH